MGIRRESTTALRTERSGTRLRTLIPRQTCRKTGMRRPLGTRSMKARRATGRKCQCLPPLPRRIWERREVVAMFLPSDDVGVRHLDHMIDDFVSFLANIGMGVIWCWILNHRIALLALQRLETPPAIQRTAIKCGRNGNMVAIQAVLHRECQYHDINTFFISHSSHSVPAASVGSLTFPFRVPNCSFSILNLSRPNTRPFGSTTGSSSM